jgi:hypothetical protein
MDVVDILPDGKQNAFAQDRTDELKGVAHPMRTDRNAVSSDAPAPQRLCPST